MIDEERQDQAAEFVLNEPDASAAFKAQLLRDPELRALTDELREAAAALAHAAPRQFPSPELRERVMSVIRAESGAVSAAAPARSGGHYILPWALAAGFAVTTAAFWFERTQWRNETLALRQETLDLRNNDALSKVRIATLSAQVEAFAKGSAVVVWDPDKQRGVIRLANLPRPEAGKDYQLWVIDPKYPHPVNGGIVPVDQNGYARVAFTTDQPIRKADKFAISVEPAGGVPKATGPIVLLGN